jgi:hypothetical protein
MSFAWIETETYIGPCRRQAGRKKLFDRRRDNGAAEAPSLAKLVRQLRVINLAFADEATFSQFRLRTIAAHELARAQDNHAAAHALGQLRRAIERGADPAALTDVAQHALDAAASAAA